MSLETINKDCLDSILSSIIYLSRTNKYFNKITKDFSYKYFVEKYNIQENNKAKNNKELVYYNKKLFCENCDKYIGKKRVFSVRQLVLINGASMYACLDCRYTYVKKYYKLIKNKDKITETEAMFEYLIPYIRT